MLHALIFAAEALPVSDRSENAGAEKPVAFRLKGPVIDGLGLGHFAMGPAPDFFGARQRDSNRVKIGDQICTVVRRRTVHDVSLKVAGVQWQKSMDTRRLNLSNAALIRRKSRIQLLGLLLHQLDVQA